MPSFGPLASYPLAGSGSARIGVDLSDSFSASCSTSYNLGVLLADALTATGTFTPDVLANLIDRLVASGSTSALATLQGSAVGAVAFADTVQSAWHMLLAESVTVAGDAKSTLFLALLDVLVATGQADGKMTAFAACAAALTLEDLVRQGFHAQAVDAALLTETTSSIVRILALLADSANVADDATPMLRVSLIAGETLTLSADLASNLTANADLADGVLFFATIRLGGLEYSGWALNTDALAASEHRNVAFDSFVTYRGQHYAAGPNGIAKFGGTSDDGAPIEAWLKTALLDFGTGKKKRVPDAYIGTTGSGDLVLKVITRDPVTGVKVEDWYLASRRQADGPGMGRVQIGRGLQSTWWQFELHNVDGGSLDLDSLALRPLALDRRT